MGDRGNIVIESSPGERVYLYTHWRGSEIGEIVAKALARRERWNDPAYLARIIFDVMTEGNHGATTGFGISSRLGDNEHPILIVDCANQQVRFETRNGRPILGAKEYDFNEWAMKAGKQEV